MMSDDELQRIYQWVDEIPLSRPKRNIARDFADGVLSAEIVSHYFPRLVEVHNYPAANSYAQKVYNWCAPLDAAPRTRVRSELCPIFGGAQRGMRSPHSPSQPLRSLANIMCEELRALPPVRRTAGPYPSSASTTCRTGTR